MPSADAHSGPGEGGSGPVPGRGAAVLLVAAEGEAKAVRKGLGVEAGGSPRGLIVVQGGVGKVNAALAVAEAAAGRLGAGPVAGIINLGIAGALPGSGVDIGDVVVADRSVYADEGIVTPWGFQDCAAMGFPLGAFDGRGVTIDPVLVLRLAGAVGVGRCRVGAVATVSTCSGTDEHAVAVRERTGALVEAMEGAAAAHAALKFGLPFAEVRIVSNTTGNRGAQVWDIRRAFDRLGEVAAIIGRELAPPGFDNTSLPADRHPGGGPMYNE